MRQSTRRLASSFLDQFQSGLFPSDTSFRIEDMETVLRSSDIRILSANRGAERSYRTASCIAFTLGRARLIRTLSVNLRDTKRVAKCD